MIRLLVIVACTSFVLFSASAVAQNAPQQPALPTVPHAAPVPGAHAHCSCPAHRHHHHGEPAVVHHPDNH